MLKYIERVKVKCFFSKPKDYMFLRYGIWFKNPLDYLENAMSLSWKQGCFS